MQRERNKTPQNCETISKGVICVTGIQMEQKERMQNKYLK